MGSDLEWTAMARISFASSLHKRFHASVSFQHRPKLSKDPVSIEPAIVSVLRGPSMLGPRMAVRVLPKYTSITVFYYCHTNENIVKLFGYPTAISLCCARSSSILYCKLLRSVYSQSTMIPQNVLLNHSHLHNNNVKMELLYSKNDCIARYWTVLHPSANENMNNIRRTKERRK